MGSHQYISSILITSPIQLLKIQRVIHLEYILDFLDLIIWALPCINIEFKDFSRSITLMNGEPFCVYSLAVILNPIPVSDFANNSKCNIRNCRTILCLCTQSMRIIWKQILKLYDLVLIEDNASHHGKGFKDI